VLREALGVSLSGGLLGIGLALGIGLVVDARAIRQGQQLFLFSPRLLAFALVFAIILGGLAAGYATLRIVRLSPADAIRRGA
jgi:ABC-type antimicrobial peptide transport system permease subunit